MEEGVVGGKKLDVSALIEESSIAEDEEDWDAMDEEEVEAMKQISSAVNVKHIDDIDIEQYPRLVMKNFENDDKVVDRLLKVLLPVSKVVYEKQEAQAEEAKVAADLREKKELLKQRRKENDARETQRYSL